MPKTKSKTKSKSRAITVPKNKELDSVYILKLTLYMLLGSQWIHFVTSGSSSGFGLPIGAVIGVILASRDRFQIDRKIEYAVLLISLFLGYFLPVGISVVI